MTMRTSANGVAELSSHEGIVPYPYKDSKGIWTWSVGLTKAAGQGDPATMPKGAEIPMDRVMAAFRAALTRYENDVNKALKVAVSQTEFDALVSFHFNTGAIASATLTKLLNAGDRKGAAAAFMNWKKPPEIIPRRQKEQKLFRDGVYSSNGYATVYPADKNGNVLWSKGRKVRVSDYLASEPIPVPPPPDIEPPIPDSVEPPSGGFSLSDLLSAIADLLRKIFQKG